MCDCQIPNEFLCPISQAIMKNPIILSDGNTYDSASITAFLKSGTPFISPLTREKLRNDVIIPNIVVRKLVEEWIDKKRDVATCDCSDFIKEFDEMKSVDVPSGIRCKCGSTTHKRTNHNSCPLNSRNITIEISNETVSDSDDDDSDEDDSDEDDDESWSSDEDEDSDSDTQNGNEMVFTITDSSGGNVINFEGVLKQEIYIPLLNQTIETYVIVVDGLVGDDLVNNNLQIYKDIASNKIYSIDGYIIAEYNSLDGIVTFI